MRIFTAVRHSVDPRFYYGGLWSGNFYPALRSLGHDVVESQVDLFPASKFMHIRGEFTPEELEARSRLTEQIIEEVQNAHREKPLHLFLSYFYNSHFDPNGFREIARLGIPTVNFYCNSIYQFSLVSEIARSADFAWHTERDARQLYLKANANPVWVQMAADPNIYHPLKNSVRQPRACFVGQRYCDRDQWLALLLSRNVPVDIYGDGWCSSSSSNGSKENETLTAKSYPARQGFAVGSTASYLQAAWKNIRDLGLWKGAYRNVRQYQLRQERSALTRIILPATQGVASDIVETFARYEIVLNFSNVWADGRPGSELVSHVRLRDFEAPMSRTCYVTGYTDEIAELYEIEKEILTYRTAEEFVDKVKYHLAHPVEAEKVRDAGHKRALRDHTWVQRFKQLFGLIGLVK